MVSAWAAVVSYAAFSTAGLLYNMDERSAASLDRLEGKLHLNPAWISSVGPAEAEAVRSAAHLVVAHYLQSQLTAFLLFNFLTSMYALWALMTKTLFLGRLSMAETGRLTERLVRFLMIKAVFMSAVVETPDAAELAMWLAWFSIIAYMKCFVGLARDRCEGLLSSPSATAAAHLRTLALLGLILCYDMTWVAACASAFPSASMLQLFLWLHDTALIFIEAGQTLASYAVYVADRLRMARAAHGKEVAQWEGRSAFLYHVDVGGDIASQCLTLAHLAHIWCCSGFSFSLIDLILFMDIRALLSGLARRLRAFARHRAASRALRERYPDADPARLAAWPEQCAICRDNMQAAKVLPCGHLFHMGCLRAWLQIAGQSNFTCPICRTSLFGRQRAQLGGRATAAAAGADAAAAAIVPDAAVGDAAASDQAAGTEVCRTGVDAAASPPAASPSTDVAAAADDRRRDVSGACCAQRQRLQTRGGNSRPTAAVAALTTHPEQQQQQQQQPPLLDGSSAGGSGNVGMTHRHQQEAAAAGPAPSPCQLQPEEPLPPTAAVPATLAACSSAIPTSSAPPAINTLHQQMQLAMPNGSCSQAEAALEQASRSPPQEQSAAETANALNQQSPRHQAQLPHCHDGMAQLSDWAQQPVLSASDSTATGDASHGASAQEAAQQHVSAGPAAALPLHTPGANAALPLMAQPLLLPPPAATLPAAEHALRAFAARLASGRASAAREAERLASVLHQRLPAVSFRENLRSTRLPAMDFSAVGFPTMRGSFEAAGNSFSAAGRSAERLSTQMAATLSATLSAAEEALLGQDGMVPEVEEEVADSGALATRLLEACLHAGLGVSEFDELLSDEIASVTSEDGEETGGSLNDYRETLEQLRTLFWDRAMHLMGQSIGHSHAATRMNSIGGGSSGEAASSPLSSGSFEW